MLPCRHDPQVVAQLQPTIALLTNLDEWHPEVLLQHAIQPADYRKSLVFRSAIESIRGSFAASSTPSREQFVKHVLENLRLRSRIAEYKHSGSRQRFDFTIVIERDPDYFAALEVKGGEGNSINISERGLWAREFGVWCHLDGAIVNEPAHGAHSIVNRLSNELVRRNKLVDVLFIKDVLCGSHLRPCPKYRTDQQVNAQIAPDIFLLPQRVPTRHDPEPPIHTIDSLRLPKMILELFGVYDARQQETHLWYVHVKLIEEDQTRLSRLVEIWHQGEIVDSSRSRPWRD